MIAADSNALLRYLDVVDERMAVIEAARQRHELYLPPVALTELLSKPEALSDGARSLILSLPLLDIFPGYWERAATLRAGVLRVIRKAAIADTLIAQSCIDHDIPLITYDRDFRHFEPAGLTLL